MIITDFLIFSSLRTRSFIETFPRILNKTPLKITFNSYFKNITYEWEIFGQRELSRKEIYIQLQALRKLLNILLLSSTLALFLRTHIFCLKRQH